MFEAEFTHEGDRCTFEVLLEPCRPRTTRRCAPSPRSSTTSTSRTASSAATRRPASRTLIAGHRARRPATTSERLARGGAVFDDLYAYFRSRRRLIGRRDAHDQTALPTGPAAPRPHGDPVRARRCASGRGSPRSASAARPARSRSCTASWSRRSAGSARTGSCTRSTTACCCPGRRRSSSPIYIGWLLHRTPGGLVAGTLFVLPGFVAIMALSCDLRRLRQGRHRRRRCSSA